MHSSQRIITALPLRELWDDRGPVEARRSRDLSAADIRDLLGRGPVRFVIADVGVKPAWIPVDECFRFWRTEVRARVADPGRQSVLAEFPGGTYYFASDWLTADGPPVVVLEKCH